MKIGHDEERIQIFTRAGCAGCESLKGALATANLPCAERRPAEDSDDRALAEWYDLPDAAPQVVVDGEALDLGAMMAGPDRWEKSAIREIVRRLTT